MNLDWRHGLLGAIAALDTAALVAAPYSTTAAMLLTGASLVLASFGTASGLLAQAPTSPETPPHG